MLFRSDGRSVGRHERQPDSGGARGVLDLTVSTPFTQMPPNWSALIEISMDGGATFVPLTAEMGGPGTGTISERSAGDSGTQWMGVWDTAAVADTIENKEPEARDASQDDNAYMVRASLVDDMGAAHPSEALTISVDNVDDVAPISSTVISLIERAAKVPGTYEMVEANEGGSYTLRSGARLTANVSAAYPTIENGMVSLTIVDEDGAVTGMIGDAMAVAEGQSAYVFDVDTTMFENSSMRLAVLVTDEAGNQEMTVLDTTAVVDIQNILIDGLLPDDPGVPELVRLTGTGALMTERTFATAQEDRPISGTAMIELDTINAATAQAYIAADMADVSDEALASATPSMMPDENGTFHLPLDVSHLSDGTYYVRIVLAASPNVFAPLEPVAFTVDNTAPPISIDAPTSGTVVNIRPSILSQGYMDPTGLVTVGLTLTASDGSEVFSGSAGGNADARLNGDEDLVNADGATTDGLTYSAQAISYITPDGMRHPSGSYTATVTATDYAGNVAEATTVFVIEEDAQAPVIASYSPTSVVNTRSPVVSVTFTDDAVGVSADGVSIEVTDADGAMVAGSVALMDADGAVFGGTAVFSADGELANGSYNVSATITDSDGTRRR